MAKVHVGENRSPAPIICGRTQHSYPFGIFYGENPLNFSFSLMLLEVSIVILITHVVRFLLKPLKQPRIVSEVIGGLIIGPSGLGRNKKFAAYMYPNNAEFVLKNVGLLGLMYFLFISGVKVEMATILKTGRKQWCTALIGVFLPLLTVVLFGLSIRKFLDEDLGQVASIWGFSSSLAITAFAVIYPIISDLNLLNSEIGRMALSTAIISDAIGLQSIIAFEVVKQGQTKNINGSICYLITLLLVISCILGGVRQAMSWIIRSTPEGQPVAEIYVTAILLSVLVIGFLSDMFGLAIANGPLLLGLAIPLGPPLGSTLVERSETIIMELLMPFAFAYVGMSMDLFSMCGKSSTLVPLFLMVLVAYISKIVAVLLASRLLGMPLRDGLTLGLMLSLRGQVEILILMHWVDLKMVKNPSFTMMVLSSTMMSAIATPLISILYDPTRPYMVNKRRTIQHTPPNTELHIVAGIHDQASVAGFIDLLDVSYPSLNSPFSVYALHLIELVGRANSVFIDHENQDQAFDYTCYNPIHNALRLYEQSRCKFIRMYPFTSVSPRRTMYQDICELALAKKAILIILPFHKECFDGSGIGFVDHGVQSVNLNVFTHAPCSVGFLVDKGSLRSHLLKRSPHHFAVLFLGGSDAREALAYADRMAGNPGVSLTVLRFLPFDNNGDDLMEKKLDDGMVTRFWVKNEGNKRVVYREVVVRNGQETVAAIRAMNNNYYNLWIVGRKQGINPVLIDGLSEWSENQELGVIGDYVTSTDFNSTASVLVVQQQVLRGQD
ncbi:hypothetical protein F0562_001147 [Nyssa sinensis]|uniref:Uncharacterized protein n=1 Tax=Nyssa sinensis TaxID=561372 RepID=A0A5J5C236_9ASTE|nr:hypothetical protein F0562_001147 [Nyssa sinensis]